MRGEGGDRLAPSLPATHNGACLICLPITHRWKCWMLLHYLSLLYFYQHIFPFCCLYLCTDVCCKARVHLHTGRQAPASPSQPTPKHRVPGDGDTGGGVAMRKPSMPNGGRRGVIWSSILIFQACRFYAVQWRGLALPCGVPVCDAAADLGWAITASRQAEGNKAGKESAPLLCSPLSAVICSASKGSLLLHLFGVC